MTKYNLINKFMYWILRCYEKRMFFPYYQSFNDNDTKIDVKSIYLTIYPIKKGHGIIDDWTPEKNIKRLISLFPKWDKASTCDEYQIPIIRKILLWYFKDFN